MGRKQRVSGVDPSDALTFTSRRAIGPDRLAIDGGAGNDRKVGTANDDVFDMSQGGNDTVRGLAGDDYAYFGSTFTSRDRFEGSLGYDEIGLQGTYVNLKITASMLGGVEDVFLIAGGDYTITLAADLVPAGTAFAVYGGTDNSPTRLYVDGQSVLGALGFFSSIGDDTFLGGAGDDFFRARAGGSDTFVGGAGYNRISLFGVANGVTFDLANTAFQTVGASRVAISQIQDVSGTSGADTISGTSASNWFLGNGGNDTFTGLGGDDLFEVGVADGIVPTAVSIDGGRNFDTLNLFANGNNTGGAIVTLVSTDFQDTGQGTIKILNVEALSGTSFDDDFTGNKLANSLFGGNGADTLDGGAGNDILYGEASFGVDSPFGYDGPRLVLQNSEAAFVDSLNGGAGNDMLFGEGGDDSLFGGKGGDVLTGGSGNDSFVFKGVAESVGRTVDTIADFESGDRIDVSAIDANEGVPRNQAFHFGATAGRAGDIVATYDADSDTTIVRLFTAGDANPDMAINLTGNITLTAADFVL